MESEKLVSVIIPTYKRNLFYLSRAVKSVRQQTYKNYEIIIVDDNIFNSNYSYKIMKYCTLNNIKYLRTNGRQGANKARNIGARYAKGEFLTFLDDDDVWLPNKLKIQLAYFSDNVGMTYTNGYVITPTFKWLYTNPHNFVYKGNLYKLLLYNYIGPTITAVIRRECFFRVGMFDETMPSKQDYDLWIRITRNYEIKGINQPLFLYMQHDSYQMTKNYALLLKGYQKLYEKNKENFETDYILNAFFYIKIAKLYKYKKKYIRYFKCVLTALKCVKCSTLNIEF